MSSLSQHPSGRVRGVYAERLLAVHEDLIRTYVYGYAQLSRDENLRSTPQKTFRVALHRWESSKYAETTDTEDTDTMERLIG